MQKQQDFHILVVDDNAPFRESFAKAVKSTGLSVHTASDGQEALDFLERKKVDLIFSDIRMPGLSGLDLLKRVKRLYPNIEIVLMTAYTETTSLVDGMDFQASGYLKKPVKRHEIIEVIQQFFNVGNDSTNNSF